MHRSAILNTGTATTGLLSVTALVLTLQGCTADVVQPRYAKFTLTHGPVTVAPDMIRYLECADGLLLVCETGAGRLSERLCRCVH